MKIIVAILIVVVILLAIGLAILYKRQQWFVKKTVEHDRSIVELQDYGFIDYREILEMREELRKTIKEVRHERKN